MGSLERKLCRWRITFSSNSWRSLRANSLLRDHTRTETFSRVWILPGTSSEPFLRIFLERLTTNSERSTTLAALLAASLMPGQRRARVDTIRGGLHVRARRYRAG